MYIRKPKLMTEYLAEAFSVEKMGTGLKRGMVLKVYKAKVAEVCGKKVAGMISGAKMKGKDDHPVLWIYCKNDVVKHHLNMHRRQILAKINERLKGEFLSGVRIS